MPGETYRLRALLEGTSDTEDIAALIRFELADRGAGGDGLRMSASVGPHFYLRTGHGLHRTDRLFAVASRARRFGVMAWGDRGPVEIKTLTLEKVDKTRPIAFFFSFDVEAAAKRAAANPIDTLIWGKIGGGEYGIRRICEVLEQHALKGNFLIDFATCGSDGEPALRRIVDFLASRGHEIHMHLHPTGVAQSWGLRSSYGYIHFDTTPYDMSRRLLDFTASRYEEIVGQPPRLFRSGAYRMNPDLVLAAGSLGIEALSNVRAGVVGDSGIGGDIATVGEPFAWENGVIEIPVDSSSPEVGSFESYLRKYDAAVNRKSYERTFNVVMHSFSLIRRNAVGVHDAFAPEYEETLHQMCQHAAEEGTAYGYGEYLDAPRLPRTVVATTRIQTSRSERPTYLTPVDQGANCNVCDAIFARSKMELDSCPSCGLSARHRQLKHVLDTVGNVFDSRRVLAYQVTSIERRLFLSGASDVLNIGPSAIHELSEAPVVEELAAIGNDSYECFLGLHLLNRVKDDAKAIEEVARVLKSGGLFVSTVPYHALQNPEHNDVTHIDGGSARGQDEVGDHRYYVLRDYVNLVSKSFVVSSIPGFDPVTKASSRIFFAYKP